MLEIGAIADVIFLNSKGQLINRFIEYDKNSIEEYVVIIKSKIK
jgi:hypothetical protein